jgi:hypothetical protein
VSADNPFKIKETGQEAKQEAGKYRLRFKTQKGKTYQLVVI